MRKVHLHDEQFDGYLHAACGAADVMPDDDRRAIFIMSEDAFDSVPRDDRCLACSRMWFPYGEPI